MSLVACGALALAAGCGSDGKPEITSDESSAAAQADPDFAGETSHVFDADLEDGPQSDDAVVLAPGVELRLTELGTVDTLPVNVYQNVARHAEVSNQDGDDTPTEVVPADGQQFLVANFESNDPQWEPANGDVPDTSATLQLRGDEETELFSTEHGSMRDGTVVASVPERAGPDDATIRIETEQHDQTLSLVDGKRRDTDVPQVYEAGTEVGVGEVDRVEGTFERLDHEERIGGEVAEAFITPYLDDDHGGEGWATKDKVYLSVNVDWEMTAINLASDHSSIRLKLPNDKTETPVNDPSSLSAKFADNAVFEIPADTEEATAVLNAKIVVGGSGDMRDYGHGSAELKIS